MRYSKIKHNVHNHFIRIILDCQHFSIEKVLLMGMVNHLSGKITFNLIKIQAFSQVFVLKNKLNKVFRWKASHLLVLILET